MTEENSRNSLKFWTVYLFLNIKANTNNSSIKKIPISNPQRSFFKWKFNFIKKAHEETQKSDQRWIIHNSTAPSVNFHEFFSFSLFFRLLREFILMHLKLDIIFYKFVAACWRKFEIENSLARSKRFIFITVGEE